MILIVQCAILLIVGGAQIFLRSFLVKIIKIAYLTAAVFFVFQASLISVLQYQEWESGNIGKLLLPPYQNIFYFLQYVGWRFWSPIVVAFLFSILCVYLVREINIKYGERFLEKEEPLLAGLSVFITGYPAALIYPVVFLMISFIMVIFMTVFRGRNFRASPYYLWIPAALLVILIHTVWLSQLPLWNLLII